MCSMSCIGSRPFWRECQGELSFVIIVMCCDVFSLTKRILVGVYAMIACKEECRHSPPILR